MYSNFYGGVHPPAFKTAVLDRPIKKVFIPKRVVLPLSQHTGSPSEPVVAVGAAVKVGQVIAKPSGRVSSALHASLAGRVTRIGHVPTSAQARSLAVTIETDFDEDQGFRAASTRNIDDLGAEELLKMVEAAGIVGMGGAAFPTHLKLEPPNTRPIDTVILNGAECEPYLTCDHRLMVERPKEILKGLKAIMKILGSKNAYIAIEDDKLAAIYSMERALASESAPAFRKKHQALQAKIAVLRTRYPQGAEKQIVKAVTDRVVPAGSLPMDVGCVVLNVGTAYAIYEAAAFAKPLIERVITITGSCVKEPMNIWVRIGTMVSDLVPSAGGFVKDPAKVITGGPMMGIAQYTMEIPVAKGTGGVVFLSKEEARLAQESVCIRCGRCLEVCPMGLVPTTLMYRVKKERFAEAHDLGITNCYECGACAYACPAKIPLLEYMKYGKSQAG